VKFRSKSVVAAIMLWPASHAGGGAVVNEADCRLIERHAPAPDVAYRPGVDVRGEPVVPADASPYGQIATPQQVAIDLSLPLRSLGQSPARLGEAEARLGQVVVDLATNQLTYNGQPLADPELAQLIAACRGPRGG
jgi:hypothetical protein